MSQTSDSITRKWSIIIDQTNAEHGVKNEIYNTEVLKSNVCNISGVYILVISNITVVAAPVTQVAFKNCAPFSKCKTKIDGTTIDDAEDLNLVMAMYNLIEYSYNYSEMTNSLWIYPKDKMNNFNPDTANNDNFQSIKYKAKILGNTVTQPAPYLPLKF